MCDGLKLFVYTSIHSLLYVTTDYLTVLGESKRKNWPRNSSYFFGLWFWWEIETTLGASSIHYILNLWISFVKWQHDNELLQGLYFPRSDCGSDRQLIHLEIYIISNYHSYFFICYDPICILYHDNMPFTFLKWEFHPIRCILIKWGIHCTHYEHWIAI